MRSFSSLTWVMTSRSFCQRARSPVARSLMAASSRSTTSRRSFELASLSRLRAAFSISSEVASRSRASISVGDGADLDGERGRGLVDQVDGLVGQEAVGDVTVRERCGGDDGRVLDADLVVRLVALLEAAQDGDGVLDVGLADVDDLEAALEGRVLLDVLAVLIQRGCADGPQLAARERRLEHVAGIDSAFGRAGTDEGMQLVDEEDDLAVRVFDLLEDGLEAVFELAAIFCAGEHGAEVERDDALVAQNFGHVSGDDAAGQAFDDGGLADAGLADEHGIVLRPAAQHLNDAADLLIATDDRIELAAAREIGEVLGELFERLELRFGILVGDALVATDAGERLQDGGVRGAEGRKQLARGIALLLGEGEQEVLRRDVFVLEVGCFLEGAVEDLLHRVRKSGLRTGAADLGQRVQGVVGARQKLLRGHADLLQNRNDDAVLVLEQRREHVHGRELGIAVLKREIGRCLDGFLRFDREFVPTNCHIDSSLLLYVLVWCLKAS